MADRTPEFLRGFIVPMNITPHNTWNSESNFTEQNPSAGHPDPEQISAMTLLSTGNQSNNGNLSIITRSAGVAGFGASYTWTDNNDSTTIEYGRDAYSMMSGFKYIFQTDGIYDSRYFYPRTVVDSADTLHVAYTMFNVNYHVQVLKIDKNGVQTTQNLYTAPATINQKMHTALLRLDDDSLLLLHLFETGTSGDIKTHRSEDAGVNWSCVSRASLDEKIEIGTTMGAGVKTFDVKKIAAAQSNGVILLLIETVCNDTSKTKRNQLFQYVSIDKGCTFQRITTETDLESNSFHAVDCVVRNGRFCVQYLATKNTLHFLELPNASSSIHLLRKSNQFVESASGTLVDVSISTDDYMQGGDTCILTEKNGNIYIYYQETLNTQLAIKFSHDGVNFFFMGSGTGEDQYYSTVFRSGDSDTQLRNLSIVKWLGRACLISNLKVNHAYRENSLVMALLGGNSNVNLPPTARSTPYSDINRATFTTSYLPIETPANILNLTATGSGNSAIHNKYLQVLCDTSFNDKRFFTFNNLNSFIVPSASRYIENGIIVKARFKVSSGGSQTFSNNIGLILEMDNGTVRYKVQLHATTSFFYIWEHTNFVSGTSFDMTSGIDIIIAMSGTNMALWYRALDENEKRKYNTGTTITNLSDVGTTTAENKVQFGQFNYTSGTNESNWLEVHVSTLGATGEQMSTGFSNPEDLNARPYPIQSQYSYVFDSVEISTKDGPTYEGDKWQIEAKKEFPLENLFHSIAPTPRIMWKSERVNSGNVPEQSIAIKFDPDTSQLDSDFMLNDLIGFHFNNINFINADIYYRHGGSWVALTSFQNRIRCKCTVAGRTARGLSGIFEPYFTLNELKNWTCYFVDGGNKHFRKIIYNTEGKFGGTSTNTKQCTITLDTAPPQTAIEIYFIPPVISFVCNMNGKRASGFKIVIHAQETYSKDIHIGILHIGPVVIPGKQYQSRSILTERGSTTITTQDGIRYSREVKPPEKVLSIDWSEGVDISSLQGDEPDIDYWVSSNQSGAEPIAVHGEVPDLLSSFIKTLSGSVSPVVYLPVISKSTSSAGDFRLLQREKEQLFCTLDSDITIDHVLGNELQSESGEIFRVASMSFREIT